MTSYFLRSYFLRSHFLRSARSRSKFIRKIRLAKNWCDEKYLEIVFFLQKFASNSIFCNASDVRTAVARSRQNYISCSILFGWPWRSSVAGTALAHPLNRRRTCHISVEKLFCLSTSNPAADIELHLLLSFKIAWGSMIDKGLYE